MSEYAKPEEFGLADLLCCAASREVGDNEIVFAGTGLPMVAIMLAHDTDALGALRRTRARRAG